MKQFEIWLADLNPRFGTETAKVRPIVIVQTNLLNTQHPSLLICPLTTNVQSKSTLLRVHLENGIANIQKDSDIMIDQLRAIDKKRCLKKIGTLPTNLQNITKENLKIILDL